MGSISAPRRHCSLCVTDIEGWRKHPAHHCQILKTSSAIRRSDILVCYADQKARYEFHSLNLHPYSSRVFIITSLHPERSTVPEFFSGGVNECCNETRLCCTPLKAVSLISDGDLVELREVQLPVELQGRREAPICDADVVFPLCLHPSAGSESHRGLSCCKIRGKSPYVNMWFI